MQFDENFSSDSTYSERVEWDFCVLTDVSVYDIIVTEMKRVVS